METVKKMTALQELEELAYQAKRRRYPNVRPECLPRDKFTDKNTNGLTKTILKCFEVHGCFATRIDSKGTYNQALKRFIPSNQKKGLPDVFAQAPSLPPIWIEVKCAATKDRLKPHQEEVLQQLKKSGAILYIAQDYESFFEWFTAIIKPKIKQQTICQ